MLDFSDPDQYVLSTQRWQCSTMISYSLKCDNDHTFDSWFASADAFDKLSGADMVTCNICGSTKVQKAIMAPRVSTGKAAETTPLMAPDDHTARAIQEMRKKIEANSDYVGKKLCRRGAQNASWGRAGTVDLWRGKTRRSKVLDRRRDKRCAPALYAEPKNQLSVRLYVAPELIVSCI
jgi:hypothetical protein